MNISPKDLEKEINRRVKLALQDTGLKIEEVLKQKIQTQFYDQYDPQLYIRVYDLINSVYTLKPVQKGNTTTVDIIMNPERMVHVEGELKELIFKWSAEGYHGNPKTNIRRPGRYIKDTIDYLKSTKVHEIAFVEALKKYGLDAYLM